MRKKLPSYWRLIQNISTLLLLSFGISSGSIVAQIVTDETLPTNSHVTENGNTLTIEQGTAAGDGGNISLTAQGIFTSGDSSITASSQLGVDGIVNINNPEVDPSSGLFQLQEQLPDPADQIFASCAAAEGSSFANIGRGGLPENPTEYIRSQSQVLVDLRDFTELPESALPQGEFPSVSELLKPLPTPIIRATGWIFHEDGTVELVASMPNRTNVPASSVTCLPKFHSKFEK